MSIRMERKVSLFRAFACAFKGIAATAKERNFKIELCFGAAALILGCVFSLSLTEWLAVAICIGLVLGGECFNSSVEAIVDLVSPDFHVLAGKAKDCAAGGVLLCSLVSFVVGCIIFIPKILNLIGV